MFWFLVIALVVVVAAVTLAVLGRGDGGALTEAPPERLSDPLPADRPVRRADVDSLRFPLTLRGYRMTDVDDALARLGAELAERDARITALESDLAGPRPGPGSAPTGPVPTDTPPTGGHGPEDGGAR